MPERVRDEVVQRLAQPKRVHLQDRDARVDLGPHVSPSKGGGSHGFIDDAPDVDLLRPYRRVRGVQDQALDTPAGGDGELDEPETRRSLESTVFGEFRDGRKRGGGAPDLVNENGQAIPSRKGHADLSPIRVRAHSAASRSIGSSPLT